MLWRKKKVIVLMQYFSLTVYERLPLFVVGLHPLQRISPQARLGSFVIYVYAFGLY